MVRRAWSPGFAQIYGLQPWDMKRLKVTELDEIRQFQPAPVL